MVAVKKNDPEKGYDTKTLFMAAAVFIGFVLIIFLLPMIMMSVGNSWLAGTVVVLVLVLPFLGLWLRGRYKQKK